MANPFPGPGPAFAPPGGHQPRPSAEYHCTPLVLGQGTFATVFAGVRTRDGLPVAFKIMRSNVAEGVPVAVIREAACLRRLSHPNILRFLHCDAIGNDMALVFEQCETDLHKLLTAEPRRVHLAAPQIFRQLLSALHYLSGMGIAHRDVKPHNVLLRLPALDVKLADFGLARAGGLPVKKYAHPAATLWYRAPDVILGSANYHAGIDMWSAGCIFFEMLAGFPLLEGARTEGQILRRVRSLIGEPDARERAVLLTFPEYEQYAADLHAEVAPVEWPDTIGANDKQLIQQMLRYLPGDRLTAAEALRHPALAETGIPETAPDVPRRLPQPPQPILPAVGDNVSPDPDPSPLFAPHPPPPVAIVAAGSPNGEPQQQQYTGAGSQKSSSGSESSVVEPAANDDS